jgi:hypothetical protein
MLKFLSIAAVLSGILLFLTLSGLAYYSLQPPEPSAQHAVAQASPTAPQSDRWSFRGFISFLFPDALAIFTFFLVIATIALGVIAYVQIQFLGRAEQIAADSAQSAKQSAEIAEKALLVSERPWVSVEIAIASDLTYNQDGEARIEIAFILKNTGKSPATNVFVDAEFTPLMTDKGVGLDKMQEICARVRAAPTGKRLLGHSIFPGDAFTYRINLGMPKTQFDKPFANTAALDFFTPTLVGCVSYLFPSRITTTHVTEFVADLRKSNPSNPKAPLAFKWADGMVRENDMVLVRSFTGGNAD